MKENGSRGKSAVLKEEKKEQKELENIRKEIIILTFSIHRLSRKLLHRAYEMCRLITDVFGECAGVVCNVRNNLRVR